MFVFFPEKHSNSGKTMKNSILLFFFFQIQKETILKSSTKVCFLAISNKGRKITRSVLVVQRKAIMMVSLGHYLSFYNGPMGPLCPDKPQPFSWVFFSQLLVNIFRYSMSRGSLRSASLSFSGWCLFAWWTSFFPQLVFVPLHNTGSRPVFLRGNDDL